MRIWKDVLYLFVYLNKMNANILYKEVELAFSQFTCEVILWFLLKLGHDCGRRFILNSLTNYSNQLLIIFVVPIFIITEHIPSISISALLLWNRYSIILKIICKCAAGGNSFIINRLSSNLFFRLQHLYESFCQNTFVNKIYCECGLIYFFNCHQFLVSFNLKVE